MATKVMRPQEIPVFHHNRRKNFYGNRNPNPRVGSRKPEQKGAARSGRPASFDHDNMRPVTILKRGEVVVDSTKKTVDDVRSDLYAGSTISMSPSPRSLPLPSFFNKKQISDDFATRDLRRLLRLD